MNKALRENSAIAGNMQVNDIDEDMNPPEDPNAGCDLFVGATIGDNNENNLYTDHTGKFPIKPFHGNQIVFVAYAYRPNAILARPMKSRSDAEMIKAYTDVYASIWNGEDSSCNSMLVIMNAPKQLNGISRTKTKKPTCN